MSNRKIAIIGPGKTPTNIGEVKRSNEKLLSEDSVFNQKIKEYLEKNLSIQISSEKSAFFTTDGSEKNCFTIKLLLGNKEISSDNYFE